MLQAGRLRVRFLMKFLPVTLLSCGQLGVSEIVLGVKAGRHVRLTASLPSLQKNLGALTSHNLMGLYGLLQRQNYFFFFFFQCNFKASLPCLALPAKEI
jgi:hypothetical protein